MLAADHLIKNQNVFSSAVTRSIELANQNYIVTLGIKPAYPKTGFGYIEADNNIVKRFVEKPSLKKLKNILKQVIIWNAGMFCIRAQDGLCSTSEC